MSEPLISAACPQDADSSPTARAFPVYADLLT